MTVPVRESLTAGLNIRAKCDTFPTKVSCACAMAVAAGMCLCSFPRLVDGPFKCLPPAAFIASYIAVLLCGLQLPAAVWTLLTLMWYRKNHHCLSLAHRICSSAYWIKLRIRLLHIGEAVCSDLGHECKCPLNLEICTIFREVLLREIRHAHGQFSFYESVCETIFVSVYVASLLTRA